jgi:hypothetical protein
VRNEIHAAAKGSGNLRSYLLGQYVCVYLLMCTYSACACVRECVRDCVCLCVCVCVCMCVCVCFCAHTESEASDDGGPTSQRTVCVCVCVSVCVCMCMYV